MADGIDPKLRNGLTGSLSVPGAIGAGNLQSSSFDPNSFDVQNAYQAQMRSPDQYWNPTTGTYRSLGAADPGSEAGKYALTAALNDANSNASNMYYYGGNANYANAQADYFQNKAAEAYSRKPVDVNTGDYQTTFGKQQDVVNQLSDLANGAPGAAQQQLQRSFGDSMAGISSNLNSSAGGPLAAAAQRAAARTAAENAVRSNDVNAAMLSANQQLEARKQLAGLTNSMRSASQDLAFQRAGIAQDSRFQNQSQAANLQRFGLGALQQGLQGTVNRQAGRANAYGNAVNIADRQTQFSNKIADQNTNSMLGAAQGAGSALGQIWQSSQDDSKKPEGKP